MRMTFDKFYCDLCEKEIADSKRKTVRTQVLFTTEQTEGRGRTPYLDEWHLDFCTDCFDKYKETLIMASGAQGHNKYWFRK